MHGAYYKAYKLCIKYNPKNLQKQHGYKSKQAQKKLNEHIT